MKCDLRKIQKWMEMWIYFQTLRNQGRVRWWLASRKSPRKMKSHFPSLVLVRNTETHRQNNLSIETFTHHPFLSEISQPSDMFPGPHTDLFPTGPGPCPQVLPLHHHQQAGGVDLPLVRQQFLFPRRSLRVRRSIPGPARGWLQCSVPIGRAREGSPAQYLWVCLVPQDWADQDEEDDAGAGTISGRF